MKCFVLALAVVVVVGASTAGAAATASCVLSEEFFLRLNASAVDDDGPGPVCGGQCCGRGRETRLRNILRRLADKRAATATRPIAELLLSTRRTLQERLTALSHQSQNKTALLFTQVYKSQAVRTHSPLASLYEDIRMLLRLNTDDVNGEDLGSPAPKDLADSAKKFFRDIFPVAYHNVLRLEGKHFTPEYEACLRDAYEAVQPFGDVPQQMGNSLSRSLEAARALLQVLAVGAGVLANSEQVLASSNEDCSTKILQAGGCARCNGLDIRPCRNYCLNVARGCIGSLLADLDAPWAGYVEGVERLNRVDADAALRSLDAKVSEAIMHALENHVVLEKKVRQECGPPSTVDAPQFALTRPAATSRRDALRTPPPDAELLQFAASLAASKRLFSGLADHLCDEPDFSNDDNEQCWNGKTLGEYTKSLVASSSLSDQRYNPEIAGGAPQDPRVPALGDRLRQAGQLVVTHSWSGGGAPAAEAFMQGDEAGEEGSGSGRSYPDDDASYDAEGSGDDGSGMRDVGPRTFAGEEPVDTSTPKTGAATTSRSFFPLILVLAVLGRFTGTS